jgi:hypothetical protein
MGGLVSQALVGDPCMMHTGCLSSAGKQGGAQVQQYVELWGPEHFITSMPRQATTAPSHALHNSGAAGCPVRDISTPAPPLHT